MHILGLVFFSLAFLAAMAVIWAMIATNFDKVVFALNGGQTRELDVALQPIPTAVRRSAPRLNRPVATQQALLKLPLAA